ncbi:hypothetical protein [Novosphingobium acidiphilum]|uniref:hypothetical protein n=1 Tax=Novosphingobium acidiphilum TaxID=505248 RepID=UPI000419FF09|nr:hypothetical protein [Novosphingobium acidiphilum]
MTFKTGIALIGMMGALVLPIAAQAQQWDHRDDRDRRMEHPWNSHPEYVQALSDLRTGFQLIQHREPNDPVQANEETRAMNEIQAAYQELASANISDGHSLYDTPPGFSFGDHRGRVAQTEDLLRNALHEISTPESNPAARDMRNRAIHHISAASRALVMVRQRWHY